MMRPWNCLFAAAVVIGTLTYAAGSSIACTGITLTAADGSIVCARTMESAMDFQARLMIVPRGINYVGLKMANRAGLHWTTKYSFVGPNVFGMPYVSDGMNERGLAVGHFMFIDFAGYQKDDPAATDRSIDACEVGTYLLGACQNVPEALVALRAIRVVPAGTTPQQRAAMAFHYALHDADGHVAVVEYVDGKLNVYQNPLGVVTNSPPLDWQLTNLRNYLHMDVENAAARRLSGVTFSGYGQGTGLVGLPGDFTPPSRFVRAVVFTQAAVPPATAEGCVEQAFHLLDQFDIPGGSVRVRDNGKESLEFTNWTAAADLKHLRYYFHSYQSRRIRLVDFAKIDREAKQIKTISMREPEVFEDVSGLAK